MPETSKENVAVIVKQPAMAVVVKPMQLARRSIKRNLLPKPESKTEKTCPQQKKWNRFLQTGSKARIEFHSSCIIPFFNYSPELYFSKL